MKKRNKRGTKRTVSRGRNSSFRRSTARNTESPPHQPVPKISNVPSISLLLETCVGSFAFSIISILTLLFTTFWLCIRLIWFPIEKIFSCKSDHKPSFRSVLITGGSAGLGKGLALIYAKRGARIVLVARRLDHLMAVKQECHALGAPKVDVFTCDVRNAEEMAKVV